MDNNRLLIYALIVAVCFVALFVTSDGYKGFKRVPVEYATYTENGISFQYPKEWVRASEHEIINYPNEKIDAIATLTKKGSENLNLKFSVFLVNESVTDAQFQNYLNNQKTASANIISQRNLTVDGVPAYEQVERIGEGQRATIVFLKDGKEYEIRLFVPDGIYPTNKNIESVRSELNTILESFKITDSGNITLNKYLTQK